MFSHTRKTFPLVSQNYVLLSGARWCPHVFLISNNSREPLWFLCHSWKTASNIPRFHYPLINLPCKIFHNFQCNISKTMDKYFSAYVGQEIIFLTGTYPTLFINPWDAIMPLSTPHSYSKMTICMTPFVINQTHENLSTWGMSNQPHIPYYYFIEINPLTKMIGIT